MNPPNTTTLLLLVTLLPHVLMAQSHTGIDPKHPWWQYFPQTGVMRGVLNVPGRVDGLGNEIHSVGDVNNDGMMDFTLNHPRIDTTFKGISPNELLLFHGVKGRLPADSSGERIGPTELDVNVRFLTAGDWDHDGYRDLCVWAAFMNDTSHGNTGWTIGYAIIYWNNGSGHFSNSDTSMLPNPGGAEVWIGINRGMSADFDGDGAEDLLLWGGRGLDNGKVVPAPKLALYRGESGHRWGRSGMTNLPSWQWWNPPPFNYFDDYAIDQDGDGLLDIPLMHYQYDYRLDDRVTMLYGRPGALPDTLNVVSITVAGESPRFSDITGDGMPELIVNRVTATQSNIQEVLKIYAGRRGQRIEDQYGSGNDDPIPGKGWWRRPWAEIWGPFKLDDGWPHIGLVLDLHDGNLDGINDLWTFADPYVLCYVSGEYLDSLIDGIIEQPLQGNCQWLGDIDASGIPTIAIYSYQLFATVFYKATKELPETGIYRKLPNETSDVPDAEHASAENQPMLGLHVRSHPSRSVVEIVWRDDERHEEAAITIRDVLGRQVTTMRAPAGKGAATWDASEVVGGAYFITLNIGDRRETARVIVR